MKHMYKGTLFVHDEYETKNSGFFSVKSVSCEKVKESKNSYGVKVGKVGNAILGFSCSCDLFILSIFSVQGKEANTSFSQSPIRTFDRENNAHGCMYLNIIELVERKLCLNLAFDMQPPVVAKVITSKCSQLARH